ncbi:MAG: hypothetical protein ABI165_17240 [Bryobacteraceae bacterium]
MFFRRETPHQPTFAERLEGLKNLGFETSAEGAGRVRVSKNGCAAVIEDRPGSHPHVNRAGVIVGKEIALMISGGFQMFLRTPSGVLRPALAPQLVALHEFDEDLREGLGIESLYNESLGTTADEHLYDRVEGRDRGAQPKPWEKKAPAARD